MDIIVWTSIALAVLTFGLLVVTSVYAYVAWRQYRAAVDASVVVYPEIRGEMVTVVVENRGGGCAYDVAIRPDSVISNHHDVPPLRPEGTDISFLGPGQRCVYVWWYWTRPEHTPGRASVSCAYKCREGAKKHTLINCELDPSWFAGASIGLSQSPTVALADRVQRLVDAMRQFGSAET